MILKSWLQELDKLLQTIQSPSFTFVAITKWTLLTSNVPKRLVNIGTQCAQSQWRFVLQHGKICDDNLWVLSHCSMILP